MNIFDLNFFALISVLVSFIISVFSLYKYISLRKKLDFLYSENQPEDMEGKVLLALKQVDEALNTGDILKSRIRKLQKELSTSITKKVLKRYNPFHDTGGNQSFSVCLLDSMCTGVIISGLYSRGQTNLYAKEVFEGKPQNNLSDEEQEVLKEAIEE